MPCGVRRASTRAWHQQSLLRLAVATVEASDAPGFVGQILGARDDQGAFAACPSRPDELAVRQLLGILQEERERLVPFSDRGLAPSRRGRRRCR
jgi:hypothetical protein